MLAIQTVLLRPADYLKNLDLTAYRQELNKCNNGNNMGTVIDFILSELMEPFKDPREYRPLERARINNHKLLLMLIEETEDTFDRGIIVTAQVTRVLEGNMGGRGGEGLVLCRLDNGLDARIEKKNLDNTDRRIEDLIQVGHVITGRIDEIRDKEENMFSVSLNCKRSDLESHRNYIRQGMQCDEEDLINQAFKVEKEAKVGVKKYTQRRINHPKF